MSDLVDDNALKSLTTRLNLHRHKNNSLRWLKLLYTVDDHGNLTPQSAETLARKYVALYDPQITFDRTLADAYGWLWVFKRNNIVARRVLVDADSDVWMLTELGVRLLARYSDDAQLTAKHDKAICKMMFLRDRVKQLAAGADTVVFASDPEDIDHDILLFKNELAQQQVSAAVGLYVHVKTLILDDKPDDDVMHAPYVIVARTQSCCRETTQQKPLVRSRRKTKKNTSDTDPDQPQYETVPRRR